jgi:hypothetical protein
MGFVLTVHRGFTLLRGGAGELEIYQQNVWNLIQTRGKNCFYRPDRNGDRESTTVLDMSRCP